MIFVKKPWLERNDVFLRAANLKDDFSILITFTRFLNHYFKTMNKIFAFVMLTLILFSCATPSSQSVTNPQKTQDAVDYSRARAFVWDSIEKKAFNLSIQPEWFEDNSGFAYTSKNKKGEHIRIVAYDAGREIDTLDKKKLLKRLQEFTGEETTEKELSWYRRRWKSADQLNFYWKDQHFKLNLKDYTLEALQKDDARTPQNHSLSPNGKYEVYLKDYNLYLKDKENNEVHALSTAGDSLFIYGSNYGWEQLMEGENTNPEPNLNLSWSPDSKKIFTQIMDAGNAEKMYLLDWSIDSLYRPKLLSYFRGSPGDTTVIHYIPVLYDLESRKEIPVDLDPIPHFMDDLAGYGLKWTKDGKYLYGTLNHRGYKKKDIIKVAASTGEVERLYSDSSHTNIDYLTRFKFIESKNTALFTSEKTGWKQLYRLDFTTGEVDPITQGEFVVKDIEAVDEKNEEIYLMISGKEEGVNPYYDLLYKVNFDGSNLKLLTEEPLNHEVHLSPDFTHFIDNQSDAETPTVSVLRSTKDGRITRKIDSADIEALQKTGWDFPQLFTITAQDGKTKIYGALWKPTNFDPAKSYPVIDYSYTGPHMNVFPNTFRKGIYGLYNSGQALAELGFIVMQVDGMGTAGRSKAFHDVSCKNMGNNLKDHALAIKELGKRYSWFDSDRVGIFGHSAGGYDAAHALMAFNDTYKVAVSESADHDWRMEKAWWPEMYAGWPVDEVYEEQSNITMAPKMKGNLLLIHGGIDENVNPSAAFKLSEALIKADKYFDLLIIPSGRHPIPAEYLPYVQKKRWQFFVDHLLLSLAD